MEYARRAYVPEALRLDDQVWPFTVPAVAELADRGLEFTRPLTFLVGDNGSGKSTIVEAIAEGFGLDARGGRPRTRRPLATLSRQPAQLPAPSRRSVNL
jgi:predicted ATPase